MLRLKRVELLLAALGSGRDPGPGQMLKTHITRLRAGDRWGRVSGGFLLTEPRLAEIVEAPWDGLRVIIPVMMCDGVVSGKTLPGLRTQALARGGEVLITPPLGTVPGFAALVASEVETLAARAGWNLAASGLLLAAHGTLENPASITTTEAIAAHLRGQHRFADIRTGYLSQPPYIGEIAAAFDRPFFAVGLFAAAGGHASLDVPEALSVARQVFIHLPAIGAVPAIADLIEAEALRALAA